MAAPTAPTPRRMPRLRRGIRAALVLLLVAALIARLAAPAVVRWRIERQIARSGWSGGVGLIDLSLAQARMQISDLRLRSPTSPGAAGGHPWLVIDVPTLEVVPSLRALISGRIDGDVTLDRPHVELVTLGEGRFPTDHPLWREGVRAAVPVRIRHLVVRDGDIRWRRLEPPATLRLAPVDVRLDGLDDRSADAADVSVRARTTGGGDLVADGRVDPFAPDPHGELSIVLRGVALDELQPLWQPQRIAVRSGRLDAFAALSLEHGRLRGSIQPVVRDLDVEEVRRRAGHQGLGGLHDIIADLSADVIEHHGPVTATVPLDVAMDQPGAAGAVTRALRQALTEELRGPRPSGATARLAVSAGTDRSAGIALDVLNADGAGWRFGGGLDARRQTGHRAAFAEVVAGAGGWLGLIRIDALPFVGIGVAADDAGAHRQAAIAYGGRLDATIALRRASIGIRLAWEATRDLRDDRTWSSPSVGLLLGFRF